MEKAIPVYDRGGFFNYYKMRQPQLSILDLVFLQKGMNLPPGIAKLTKVAN